jgi:beta-glucosidase
VFATAVAALTGITAPAATAAQGSASCPWLSPDDGDSSQRAAQVAAAMTSAQQASYLAIRKNRRGYQNYIPAIPSLCLPSIRLQDGPAGIAAGADEVTQLPAPIAVAATWDPAMATDYGDVVGAEARTKGITVAQAPMVNIARVPEAGRNFEAMGEDPTLVSDIADSEIEAIQSHDVVAEVKHFAASNQESNRRSLNVAVAARTLHEIYFPAFRSAVQTAHVGAVMCAHNRINGVYACQSSGLLTHTLRKSWGFNGFVRSDNRAVHDPVQAFGAGDDIIKPLSAAAIEHDESDGQLSSATVTASVEDVLRVMFAFGLVSKPLPEDIQATATSAAHRSVAARVAEAGTVLLRNRAIHGRPVLPLHTRSLALIGSGAASAPKLDGGGSSRVAPSDVITPLQAMARSSGPMTVRYATGTPYVFNPILVPAQQLRVPGDSRDGIDETVTDGHGHVLDASRVKTVSADFGTASQPAPPAGATAGGFAVTWSGDLMPSRSGTYRLELRSDDGGTISLGGHRIAHGRSGDVGPVTVRVVAGKPVPLTVHYSDHHPGGSAALVWGAAPGPRPSAAAAVRLAHRSGVAVVFANDNEREGRDRANLDLPPAQNHLIRAVAAANPRTVVVLDTGGAVLMPWLHRVAAVVQAWYPGEMDGRALHAVLSGKVDPAGRLPITFPRSNSEVPTSTAAQWPGVNGTATYSEGLQVGYRWYDAHHRAPLFPFGFGLSYTRFGFSHEHLSALPGGGARVAVTVRNRGQRAGSAVPEVYLHFPASAGEPPEQLRSFTKVALPAGGKARVRMALPTSAFRYWTSHGWRLAAGRGRYRVSIGQSSGELPLRAAVPPRWLPPRRG